MLRQRFSSGSTEISMPKIEGTFMPSSLKATGDNTKRKPNPPSKRLNQLTLFQQRTELKPSSKPQHKAPHRSLHQAKGVQMAVALRIEGAAPCSQPIP
jgi:hypothetical protein